MITFRSSWLHKIPLPPPPFKMEELGLERQSHRQPHSTMASQTDHGFPERLEVQVSQSIWSFSCPGTVTIHQSVHKQKSNAMCLWPGPKDSAAPAGPGGCSIYPLLASDPPCHSVSMGITWSRCLLCGAAGRTGQSR
jgi:hypothetical protein